MKLKLSILFVLVLVILSCENESDPTANQTPLPSSMKGYELYSWKTQGKWNYTLITGTNRAKTSDEIISTDNVETTDWVKISVYSLTSVKQLLSRLPANENVSWISAPSRISGFPLPDAYTVAKVELHCNSQDLILQIIR